MNASALTGLIGLLDLPHNTAVVLRGVTILGAASGVVGTFLLLRKRSLTADALSHAALPGVALAFMLGVAVGLPGRSLWLLLLGAAVIGLIGVACIHVLGSLSRVREDAAIGIVLSVFFAVGLVLLDVIQSMPAGQKAGLNHFIFGQAATMRSSDSHLIAVGAAAILVLTIGLFKEWRLLCFDDGFAGALGFHARALDIALLAIVTVITVIGLHAVGALLMVALLIIPAAAARFWTDRLEVMTAIAGVIGAASAGAGALVSAELEHVPTGPAIVLACGGLFILSLTAAPRRGFVAQLARRWALDRRIARQHLLRAMYECGELSGDPAVPVTTSQLLSRRRWSLARLERLQRRLLNRKELSKSEDGLVFTPRGKAAAQRIVRTHRLWEHYLRTQADIAPSHVDRAADDIEHVLGEPLVAELERTLHQEHAIPLDTPVPPSPHELQQPGGVS